MMGLKLFAEYDYFLDDHLSLFGSREGVSIFNNVEQLLIFYLRILSGKRIDNRNKSEYVQDILQNIKNIYKRRRRKTIQ